MEIYRRENTVLDLLLEYQFSDFNIREADLGYDRFRSGDNAYAFTLDYVNQPPCSAVNGRIERTVGYLLNSHNPVADFGSVSENSSLKLVTCYII